MRQRVIEIIVGLFVLFAIAGFVFLAFRVSGLTIEDRATAYDVTAEFSNVGDLKVRAPVSIGGVRVGRVVDISLDPNTLNAMVTLRMEGKQNKIPADSSASIFTEGLLGSNYISLSPGVEEENFLKDGSKIEDTHPALILENLIGQLLFNLKK